MAETKSLEKPSVPDSWPGAFGIYESSKQAVKFNLEPILLLIILNLVIGGGINWKLGENAGLITFVVGAYLMAASTIVYLASLRGQQISINKTFSDALPFWLRMMGLQVVLFASLFVSFLLLVIPFFFVLPRVILANYFLVDKNLGIMDSMKASWNATRGHSAKIWGVIGANIAMALLMITIIGIPFAIYFLVMYSAALAILYLYIVKHPQQS